jgi:hypothetical protein
MNLLTIALLNTAEAKPTASSTYAVLIAPGEYTDFPDAERPGNTEACQGLEEHLLAQGLLDERVTGLCGASATKETLRLAVTTAAKGAEANNAPLVIQFSGHIVDMSTEEDPKDIYFVPSNGFTPNAESNKMSLVADDELVEWVREAAPELALISVWVESVDDPQAPVDSMYGTRVGGWQVNLGGLPAQASVFGMTILGDSKQEPVLMPAASLCWVPDDDRASGTSYGSEMELMQGELKGCIGKEANHPRNPWYKSYKSFRPVESGSVVIVLQDYEEEWDVSPGPPQLGDKRHWAFVGGGYGLAAVGLVGGAVASNHYNTYMDQLREVPFQGAPSDEQLVIEQAQIAERNMAIGYGTALGAATLTTTYLYIRWISKKRSEQAPDPATETELAPEATLAPWIGQKTGGLVLTIEF